VFKNRLPSRRRSADRRRLFGNERKLQVIDDPIDKLILIDALVYAFFYSTYD